MLAPSAEHADWLNINRPIFAARALRVVLWCDAETSKALARQATDFFDWISHRVECPPGVPAFAVAGLRSALLARAPGVVWTGERLEEVFRVAFPKRRLRWLSAKASWGSLQMSIGQHGRDWLAFVDLESEHRINLIQFLCVAKGVRGRVVLVNPDTQVLGCQLIHDRLIDLAETRAQFFSAGVKYPGRLAALLGLEPEAVDLARMLLERGVAEQDIVSAAREGGDPGTALARIAAERGMNELLEHVVTLWHRSFRDSPTRQAQRIAWRTFDGYRQIKGEGFQSYLDANLQREESMLELFSQSLAQSHQGLSPEQLSATEKKLRDALALLEQGAPQQDIMYAFGLRALAITLEAQSRLEEVESLLRRELAIEESLNIGQNSPLIETLQALARVLLAQGRPEEAELFAERALELATREGLA